MNRLVAALVTIWIGTSTPSAAAVEVYQTAENFLLEVFPPQPPEPRVVWIAGDLKQQVKRVMGHRLSQLRVRYWARNGRTAWILEEIGKVEPITAGFVVEGGKIERVKILIYRENRGWEVRYPAFTDQFRNAGIGDPDDLDLDRGIDGITGATLSVRAITRLAQLALVLDAKVSPASE
jgi:hypothetical protein